MEISLIRHGKSKCIENNPITCKEFKNWVEKYDEYGYLKKTLTLQKLLKE